MRPGCREVEELLPSYAFHALSSEEEERVEVHLAACPWCAEQARRQAEVTAGLASAFPQLEPPAQIRARLLKQVQRERGRAEPVGWLGRLLAAPALAASAAVAVVLLLAASVTLGALSLARASELAEENAALAAQLDSTRELLRQQRSLSYLIAAPGTRTVVLAATEKKPGAYGMMMVNEKRERGILVVAGLDQLPPDRVYQAWLIRDGQRTSAAVFRVDESGWGMVTLRPDERLDTFDSIGVTEEPAPGVPSPTTDRLLGGQLELQ